VDEAIGAIVEPITALIMVCEVFVLGIGIVYRYVLRDALVWTDEIAVLLLVWMGMLGAVTAYRRGQHVRLTVVVNGPGRRFAPILDVISSVVVAAFALELLPATTTYPTRMRSRR
jgi:TRAP-type C4-dicarboxylate transport system permease small subunit